MQTITMQVSLGYFLFDLAFCTYYRDEKMLMLVHHFSSILGLLYGLLTGVSGAEVVATVAGAEITNPSLHTRWFVLHSNQYRGSTLALVNDIVFTATFFAARVLVGTVLTFMVLTSPRVHWPVKVGGVILYILGIVWFICIADRWRARLCGRGAKPSPKPQHHRE